jgi:RNA polymerase sigma factor (TIGR02999 family)
LALALEVPMADNTQPTIPRLLEAASAGDRAALDDVVALLYEELRTLARRQRRRWRGDHTLDTTGLVHETYLKLVQQQRIATESRAHFLALASRAMRHILSNYAAERRAQKRGGGLEPISLREVALAVSDNVSAEATALDGDVAEAERLARLLVPEPPRQGLTGVVDPTWRWRPWQQAGIFAALGDADRAVAALRRAHAAGLAFSPWWRVAPMLAAARAPGRRGAPRARGVMADVESRSPTSLLQLRNPSPASRRHASTAAVPSVLSARRSRPLRAAPRMVVWISVAGVAETAEFSATYALPPGRVFTVKAARYVTPVMLSRSLGIGGVPTRVIVDNEWRLRDIELGGAVPADSMFITLCAATPEAGDAN